MSTESAASSGIFIHQQPSGPRRRHPLVRLYERFNPSQGWATLAILLGMLLVVGDSFIAADWVKTPGLMAVIFWGALAGILLAKVKLPFFILHPIGIAVGLAAAVWQTTSLTDSDGLAAGALEIWDRVDVWYEAASNDGISTDLLPFALAITALGWFMGYVGSWYLFRRGNVWVAVVLGGTALLTNLSFLPDKFGSRFFLFTFFAMLLLVRMSVVQNHVLWKRNGTVYSLTGGWLTMHAALWFSIVVLALAALLPMRVLVSENLAHLWSVARSPVEGLEEHFARLFSGVPNRKDVHGRFFGKTLPFVGEISFGGEVVFWATTEYPSYWLSQTYSEYTSQGWKAGDSQNIAVGPDIVSPPRSDFLKRVSVDQSLQLSFPTKKFLSGGSLDWVSHDGVVESLAPKKFKIDLLDDTNDQLLPEDIQRIGARIREELRFPPDRFVESFVSRILPEDLVLEKLSVARGQEGHEVYVGVTLIRKEPITPEVVSWAFSTTLPENEPYSLVSFVSLADDDDLRGASTDYGNFITDHYLQLPSSLPDRVREKALALTESAETPLDKALALQEYLRGDGFTYSHDIEAPPRGADGTDFFLFETKIGYSDYFASSMTVMLRAAGVPARMAAGYGPGEWDPEEEVRVVRDRDSHGWTQVYFPDYGWIDFEPTPNWPRHERKFIAGPGSGAFPNRLGVGAFAGDESDFLDPQDLGEDGFEIDEGLRGGGLRVDITGIVVKTGIGMVSVAALIVVGHLVWNFGLGGVSLVEQLYAKMNRLAVLAGVGRKSNQTPSEFAGSIQTAAEEAGPAAQRIAWAFSSERYSEIGGAGSSQSAEKLVQDWKEVRGSLISAALRRLMPFGRDQGS